VANSPFAPLLLLFFVSDDVMNELVVSCPLDAPLLLLLFRWLCTTRPLLLLFTLLDFEARLMKLRLLLGGFVTDLSFSLLLLLKLKLVNFWVNVLNAE
jgi:hypothetical protein